MTVYPEPHSPAVVESSKYRSGSTRKLSIGEDSRISTVAISLKSTILSGTRSRPPLPQTGLLGLLSHLGPISLIVPHLRYEAGCLRASKPAGNSRDHPEVDLRLRERTRQSLSRTSGLRLRTLASEERYRTSWLSDASVSTQNDSSTV